MDQNKQSKGITIIGVFMKKHSIFLFLSILNLTMLNTVKGFAGNYEMDFYASAAEKKADSGVGFRLKDKADISAIFSQEFKNFKYNPYDVQRYGALLRIKKEHFFCDMTLYAGTLRYGGSYSRLKNPSLASPSALSTVSFLQAGIKPALPSFSSSKRQESAAIKTPVFTGSYFEDGTHSWSIQKSTPHFSIAISGAEFIYGRKLPKSWFTKERFFAEKKYSSYDAELCFTTKTKANTELTSCNAAGIIENPFGGIEKSFAWARTQDSFRISNLFIQTSLFHAWTPLMILPSGSKPGIKNQFILNPKLVIHPFDTTLKVGILLQKNEKVKTSFPYNNYGEYTLKSQLAYSFNRTKIDIQYSTSYSEKTGKASYRSKLSAFYEFNNFSLKASAGATFSPERTTFTFSQSIAGNGAFSASVKLNSSIIYKEGFYDSSKLSCNASMIFTTAHTKWQGKINLTTSF